jgi:hypothetical protein
MAGETIQISKTSKTRKKPKKSKTSKVRLGYFRLGNL